MRLATTVLRAERSHLGPLLFGTMLAALVAGRLETALLCLAAALAGALAAGAALPSRRWLLTLAGGAAIGWALNLYLTPGRPLAGAWPLIAGRAATVEGLLHGLLLTLRVAGAFAALQGLRAAWPGERAADAVARLLGPLERLGVPVREARAMLGLALRFAPLVQAEAVRVARVQDLRAGRPPRGAREWLQRRRAATVPTLVGSLERAERVALALEARHYRVRPVAGPAPGASAGSWVARASGLAGAALVLLSLLWRA